MSKQTLPIVLIVFMVIIVVGIFSLNKWVMSEIDETQSVQKKQVLEKKVYTDSSVSNRPKMSQVQGNALEQKLETIKEENSKQEKDKEIIYELPLEDVILVQ